MSIIVYTDIVGDLFHYGHAELFKKCRQFGDVLYVGVCADELVASYKRTPVLTLDERVRIIESCQLVDKVFPACPSPVTRAFIDENNIDVVVRGGDMNDKASIDRWYAVPQEMNILNFVPYTQGISTSEILGRIKKRVLAGEL
jgi:cytidyltransferase-like protein